MEEPMMEGPFPPEWFGLRNDTKEGIQEYCRIMTQSTPADMTNSWMAGQVDALFEGIKWRFVPEENIKRYETQIRLILWNELAEMRQEQYVSEK